MVVTPSQMQSSKGEAASPNSEAHLAEDNCDITKEIDGPQGWIVVAASSSSLFVYLGIIYSWGILQPTLAEESSSPLIALTFVGSLASSFMTSLSPIAGVLIRKYGHRHTALAGAALMGLGELLSSWATGHLYALFIAHGLIFGTGGGLTILACSTAPISWFQVKRGLATGVVFAGGSMGSAAMAVVTYFVHNSLDSAWTFRVLALIIWAICLPAAWLLRQPKSSPTKTTKLQWYRFSEKLFIILMLGTTVGCFPIFIPPYFLPIFARLTMDSQYTGIISLAIWNLSATVGRIGAGFSADKLLGPVDTLIITTLLAGVSFLVIWPFASALWILILFSVLNGLGCGAFFSLVPTVIGSVFGPKNTPGILPLLWATWFPGFLFGSPIAAGLYSLSSGASGVAQFRSAAYFAGAASMVGAFFFVWLRFARGAKPSVAADP